MDDWWVSCSLDELNARYEALRAAENIAKNMKAHACEHEIRGLLIQIMLVQIDRAREGQNG